MGHLDYDKDIKEILKMIKDKVITPQEGHKRLEEFKLNKISNLNEGYKSKENASYETEKVDEVAIIGISGRFPGANNLDEYWDNLCKGKSSIIEVPKERWDNDTYYDPDLKKLDKTNSRWGGFLDDIDKFDPLFFNISGMEAEVMDPQQRLFLEESWSALEDSGYANDKISGNKCGVYVAAAPRDYLININDKDVPGSAQAFWGNTGSILASRISYLLNLKGPAMAVDTACSSSLVAIHLACQSIFSGEVDMAIAGGVWICTTPHYYILTSNAGMLSEDGKCKTFDNEADGIVNGEGVGAIVLKSLKQAIKDKDYIYGVIKSSGINQDGKTNGITAPSSLSQTELELEVYDKGNINPETISYIETHGTGTKLGDPIEIEALNNSFKKYTDKKQFCALGSVKTNIGHASLAAGMASVIKVLLSLKYKKIPPSLNFNKSNELIDFDGSPFYVNTALQDWKDVNGLRRSAVSSFGLGGTNAHLVIDEFKESRQEENEKPSYIATFSAKTSESLKEKLKDFTTWSKKNFKQFTIGDISYTLNYCRKHFPIRVAFVVSGEEELNEKIKDFLSNNEVNNIESTEKINNKDGKELLLELNDSSLSNSRFKELLLKLSDFYVNRGKIDWDNFYKDKRYYKVPLPTYPFLKNSYWIDENESKKVLEEKAEKLHLLIDENISSLKEQKFKTFLEEDHILIKDCYLDGQQFIPSSCYLEMALFTGEVSGEKKVRAIEDAICASNISNYGKGHLLKTYLYPHGEDCYAEIMSVHEQKEDVCAQAKIIYENEISNYLTVETVDIDLIKEKCTEIMDKDDYYKYLYDNYKYEYGENLKGIKKLFYSTSSNETLVEVVIPDSLKVYSDKFIINPLLLEGAYQASLILTKPQNKENLYYYSGFERLVINEPLLEKCYIHTALSRNIQDGEEDSWYYTVKFINPQGNVALLIDNLRIRSF